MRRELPMIMAAAALALAGVALQLHAAWAMEGAVLPCSAYHPDCLALQWLYGWAADRVLVGDLAVGAETLANYWPVGDRPLLGGAGQVYALLAPWQAAWGWPEALLPFTSTLVFLNGLAGYVLARGFGATPAVALLGTVILGLNPYSAEEFSSGRMGEGFVAPLAVFLGAWNVAVLRGGWLRMLAAAAALAVTAATYWYAAWFGVLAGAGLWMIRAGQGLVRATVGQHALFSGAFLAAIAPLALPFLDHWAAVPGVAALDFPPATAATDRLHLRLSVPPGAPPSVVSSLVSLPALVLAAAWPALAERRRSALALSALVIAFIALGLGDLGPASPYRLLYGLTPALQRFWWPIRHVMVVNCGLVVLACGALNRIVQRRPHPLLLPAVLAGTVVSLRIQGAPLAVSHTAVSLDDPAWAALEQAADGVVLSLPLSPSASASNIPMLWQLRHKKPMLTGHSPWVDRARPPAWDRVVADNSFLSAVTDLETGKQVGDRLSFTADDLEALRSAGLRWLVLDRSLWAAELSAQRGSLDQAMDGLFGRPLARSPSVVVWDMGAWTGETAVAAPSHPWPSTLAPAGPEHPLAGRRPASSTIGTPQGPRTPGRGTPP